MHLVLCSSVAISVSVSLCCIGIAIRWVLCVHKQPCDAPDCRLERRRHSSSSLCRSCKTFPISADYSQPGLYLSSKCQWQRRVSEIKAQIGDRRQRAFNNAGVEVESQGLYTCQREVLTDAAHWVLLSLCVGISAFFTPRCKVYLSEGFFFLGCEMNWRVLISREWHPYPYYFHKHLLFTGGIKKRQKLIFPGASLSFLPAHEENSGSI